ncbi:hypothetical protein ASG43_12465 [Aureimonas sp. Leaf454]|uniref:hypothetical protein n=1 Tax=Aureimonas sp. Leaf454 TaxID=1736381 RepID=UPI0006F69C3F|nr:hypothetical protein [Aureimonas sp. Leaf454]KQT45113.1 hypothetical protein ASG43_12465 [Aureimonas sp. Leaf454]
MLEGTAAVLAKLHSSHRHDAGFIAPRRPHLRHAGVLSSRETRTAFCAVMRQDWQSRGDHATAMSSEPDHERWISGLSA